MDIGFPKSLQGIVLWPERRRWDKLFAESLEPDQWVRSAAAAKLLLNYPSDRRAVQPARFGNIVRSYEEHTSDRWGLDHPVVWPSVEALFTEQEQALHDEVRTTLSFAIMGSVMVLVVGVANWIGVLSGSVSWRWGLLWDLMPLLVWYAVYRMLVVDALRESGRRIRSSMDLHRLDLYRALGVRGFETFTDQERRRGNELSRYLSIGPQQQATVGLGRRI